MLSRAKLNQDNIKFKLSKCNQHFTWLMEEQTLLCWKGWWNLV